jgi:hypothetical protein
MCLVVVLIVVIVFNATSLLPTVAPANHGIPPPLNGNTRRCDGDHGVGIPLMACGGTANVSSSSGCSGSSRSSGRGRGGGGDSKWRTMQPLSPFSNLEAFAKESIQKKEKAEKFYFYLQQQLLIKMNLDPIFSKSRFGTIANKNKKKNYGRHPLGACRNLIFCVVFLFLARFSFQSSFFSESRFATRPLFCLFIKKDWLAGQPNCFFFVIQIFVLFCSRFFHVFLRRVNPVGGNCR